MEVFHGTIAFQGIAIGKIQYYQKNKFQVPQHTVSDIRWELERFQKAKKAAKEQLRKLYEKSCQEVGEYQAQIFLKLEELLQKSSFSKAIENMILGEKVSAAYAVAVTRDELTATFSCLEDPVIRERVENIRELADRLIVILDGIARSHLLGDNPVILAAMELTPTEIMEVDNGKILALITRGGSKVSHASILAKMKNIPSIVDLNVSEEWDGRTAVVDGNRGVLYLDPDPETISRFEEQRIKEQKEREELLKLSAMKNITRDGREIELYANIASLDELNEVFSYHATGIGMLRSEFQYLGRENYPREGELFRAYKKLAETMKDKLAVIRTVDLGGDKKADYMEIPQEENPAMGNRGIRLCLDRRRMFKAQLRAIYRASAYGNLALMYPMITSVEEMKEIQEIVREVQEGLRRKGIPFKEIPQGIMVETPAAALISDELAREADFLSLGTNDLTQYTLAMDIKNYELKERFDLHHPAVMRLIEMTVKNGHAHGCRVTICGELASDTSMTETFLRMGVDALSVVPACILPVRKAIRETDLRNEDK